MSSKEEIYKKILEILEKKVKHNIPNQNEHKIQPHINNQYGGDPNLSNQIKLTKLLNGVGNAKDIKSTADKSFSRISKHVN